MMHDFDAQSSTATNRHVESDGIPGLWPAAIIAVASGVLVWIGLILGSTAKLLPAEGGVAVSELAEVDEQDLTAALTTMSGSNAFLAHFKRRKESCPEPLAWVSLAGAAGQPTGTVRLQSGSYFSPLFNLSDVPIRVAIPFPSPYEAGAGELILRNAGASVTVALTPGWHVSAKDGEATHRVMWHPIKRCMPPNG